ncbi:Neurogenic locus notch homolog protein 1 [Geodia barretti]|uniref:Neurogenic locus notch homolog protein 1 n=1 Tax=Geodia barretti TaxID=519541 RepID=A0AA35X4U2_GEOBA|nr:Neurogenic locus notch homolog protein 1 [Geodia barretti]
MKSLRLSMLFLLLVIVVVGVHCYSTGAPASACSDIYPVGHLGTSQDLSTNPFQLSLSDFDQTYGGEIYYVPGQDYTLTLSGSGGEQFRGFLVQARALADGSPVGTFIDNRDDQTLSSCNPPESAVTHSSSSLKSLVTLRWTAPAGAGEIRFLFSIVVQNSQGNSTFYATPKSITLNSCGLPLYESDGRCVETCPDGQFGNGTTGQCQQLPTSYDIALNATVYYAEILSDYPLNSSVFKIRVYFSSTVGLLDAHISLSQTGQINNLFEFEGGRYDTISVSTGDFISIGDHSVFDTAINLVRRPGAVFAESDYPVDLHISITLNTLFSPDVSPHRQSIGSGTIYLAPDPCDNLPCANGSTCEAISSVEYTCHCPAGYAGSRCSEIDDACLAFEPCISGSCTAGTGADYSCECFTGFTGTNCSENIDDCPGSECVNGTCVDGIANYTCDCDPGFNGTLCDQEINECHTADCNNGTCTDLVNDYMCQCYQDYTGQHCDTLLSCSSSPCENEGTCIDEEQGTFLCLCPPEWTGMTCGEDALPCDPNPCSNGGNCSENGAEFSCDCVVGWTGDTCADDDRNLSFCEEHYVCNGGTCNEDYGPNTNCSCVRGFTGDSCDDDDPSATFCDENSCLNGGTCYEVFGDATVCVCLPGYYCRTRCSEVVISCASAPCENGGTCVDDEDYSGSFKCLCPREWAGETCTDVAPLTEADSEQLSSLAITGGAVFVIVLLFGLTVVGFCLACVLACKKKSPGKRIAYATAGPQQYNHDPRTDFDGVITSNCNTSAVDLSGGDRTRGGLESQQEMWQFPPEIHREEEEEEEEEDEDRAFRPLEAMFDNDRSSPLASLLQYHLTLAMNAEAEAEEMEEELSQES